MAASAHGVIGKTLRPRASAVVARSRLFRRLDLRRPLTWVWGPPGSGKTTLVASYLAARRIRNVWYRLDAGDADVDAFLRGLSRDGGRGLAAPPGDKADSPAARARPVFRALYERLPRPFVLALDSYDELPLDSVVHDVVREAVMQLPPGGRIVVTSRAVAPAAFARLRASRAVAELGWDDLRLTAQETHQLVRRTAGIRSQEVAAQLHARTEGWAAGLALALQERRPLRDERRGASEAVCDYFATEILERVDADTRDTLLRTAFLPQVTTAMADALTGRPGAGQALVELHRQKCFIVERRGDETTYEFTATFRAFLRRRAHAVFPPDHRRTVERQAANLLARNGRVETAGALLRAARDWEGLADFVVAHGGTLSARRLDTIGDWPSAMPDEVATTQPWLLLWRGTSGMTRSPAASRDDFEAALGRLAEAGDAAGTFLAWAGAVQTYLLEHDDYGALDAWIARLSDLRRRFPEFPSPEIEARVASSMLAALLVRQPQAPAIKAWASRALALGRLTADPAIRRETILPLLAYRLSTGEFEAASALAAELRITSSAPDTPASDRIAAALVIGRLEWLTGDFASARSTLEAALGLARSSGVSLFNHRLLGEAALATLSEGNLVSARRWLADMRREISPRRRGDRALSALLISWEALLAGEARSAVGQHEDALTAAQECGMPVQICLAHLVASLVLDGAGTPGAHVHLAVASGIAQQVDSAILIFTVGLVEAHLAVRRGDEGRAIQALVQALRIGRDHRYLNSWLWSRSAMAELAARALDTELEVDYVCALIRQRHLEPEAPPVHLETWPWRIKVFTLGRFDLLVDDRPVRFPRKAQKKPLALLQALVALGGRSVREEQLTESLWPDSDGDAASQALSVTLHRLRRLLGHDGAIVRADGHIGLAPSLCWVDVWAVEQTLTRAEAAIARSPVRDHEWAASLRWTDRAVTLYRGEFLGDPGSPWADRVGTSLRDQLLRQLRRIGLLWEGIGDWEAAAESYRRAVTISETAEDFHRRLMFAYLRLDRRGDAKQAYQRCRKRLAALGVTPSAETEALARMLEDRSLPGGG